MRISLSIVIFAVATSLCAQDSSTISVNVNVVTLLATVHDRSGRIVSNLTPDDFLLEEDGKPQKIRYFSRESDLPLTIGLLIDTSRSQWGVLSAESQASNAFLRQVLREGKDKAFVGHFDTRVEVLQTLTSSRSDLSAALGQLSVPDELGTLIYSAIRQCSNSEMSGQVGRKALILLTDGVAYKDHVSMDMAIDAAQRADTILYSIRYSDPIRVLRPVRAAILEAMKERGKEALKQMAKDTGGVSYEVKNKQPIEAIYSQIEETLRNQYSIGYIPPRQSPDGKYHKIKLVPKDHNLMVVKVKYLAAFTAAILNNQPMGFYSAAVLVKDAQRHGLRVKPIDVQVSQWQCMVEHENDGTLSLRIGLGYARSLKSSPQRR